MTFTMKLLKLGVLMLALVASGCGELTGRSPSLLVIHSLSAARGNDGTFSGTLESDVLTKGSVFTDPGKVELGLVLRNQSGVEASDLNQITITRYRVSYRRTDGRATPGVDVPYPFDSAFTVSVPAGATVTGVFDLVRNSAKSEAPLRALTFSGEILSVIADVTFYGQDLAGNAVSATGSIGITFADFADPTN